MPATQVAQWIYGHAWWVLGIPVSIVLNALARSAALRIRTSTRFRCDKAEDQGLKELGVPAGERRKLALDRVERDPNRHPP